MSKSLLSAAVGAAVATLIAGGVAWAAIPSSTGVINACFKNQNGQLRVVEDAGSCQPSEQAIAWNEEGVKGDTGDKGDRGETGPQGAQGTPGPPGAPGERGPQGERGPAGADGADGARGPQGDRGPQGFAGPQGDRGPQGITGPTGPQGASGVSGYTLVLSARVDLDVLERFAMTAMCPAGKRPAGGGYWAEHAGISQNMPSPTVGGLPDRWLVTGQADGSPFGGEITVYAICMTA